MEFAIGFAAGSLITFIVLAIYGFKGMVDNERRIEQEMQVREEQLYQAGYVNGFQDGQQEATSISTLPITKN